MIAYLAERKKSGNFQSQFATQSWPLLPNQRWQKPLPALNYICAGHSKVISAK
jgi:hypothetical protein